MAHFAKIDENNVVIEVIVVEPDFVQSGALGDPSKWIQTSYNTREGVHYKPNQWSVPSEDQSKALRKNYAGPNYTYDPIRDAFIPPKPFNSWILNEQKCNWEAPVPYPEDTYYYRWSEKKQNWIVYPIANGAVGGPEVNYFWDDEKEEWILEE